MALIYWIIGFAVITLLFWSVNRSNQRRKKPGHKVRHAEEGTDLERENYRLRHVLAELSVENHSLKYKPPEYW